MSFPFFFLQIEVGNLTAFFLSRKLWA